jgi:hypothetical protein
MLHYYFVNKEDKNIKIILLLIKLSLIPIFACQLSKLMQCVGLSSRVDVYEAIRDEEGANHL